MANHTKYTPELAQKICALVMQGKGVRTIADELGGTPCATTIFNWLGTNKEFQAMFFAAKRPVAVAKFERIDELGEMQEAVARDKTMDPKRGALIVTALNNQVQNIKWEVSHLWREKYGEKVEVDLTSDPLAELLEEFRSQYQTITGNAAS